MGCGSSSYSAVYPLTDSSDEDEIENKHDDRGDSAVSKVTADSGVEMENNLTALPPGAVPKELVQLTPENSRESEDDKGNEEAAPSGLPQQESQATERPKSSDILEDLLSYGIIPEAQIKERGSGAAYNIMLGEKENTTRKPPARLESLKARKAQSLYSKEEFDEKMRMAEERRKFKEDELKTRLRTKSARIRGPLVTSFEDEEQVCLSPVEVVEVKLPLTPEIAPALLSQNETPREPAEGVEWFREGKGDGKDLREKLEVRKTGSGGEGEEKGKRGEPAKMEKDEEKTQVEEFKGEEFFVVNGKLESDFSFQHPDDREEIF